MKTRALKVMSMLVLISLLVGCTSAGFEIGPGGPNLHLEFSSEAKQAATQEKSGGGELPSLAAWDQNAEAFSTVIGERITLELPPNGFEGNLWGLGVYTTDSSIGTAAVHMGLITFKQGGVVTIEINEGRTNYGGLLRNSVTSATYDSWPLSFVFIDEKGNRIGLGETGGVTLAWYNTIGDLGLEEGESMTVSLPSGGSEREIWGSDPYTGDSPIGSAAVHKGLLSFETGGTVSVRKLEEKASFAGSERNGIVSGEYDAPNEAYTFVR